MENSKGSKSILVWLPPFRSVVVSLEMGLFGTNLDLTHSHFSVQAISDKTFSKSFQVVVWLTVMQFSRKR